MFHTLAEVKQCLQGKTKRHMGQLGKASSFAGAERGAVQDCPHCGAYLDVPGEDDEGHGEWEAEEPEGGDGSPAR